VFITLKNNYLGCLTQVELQQPIFLVGFLIFIKHIKMLN